MCPEGDQTFIYRVNIPRFTPCRSRLPIKHPIFYLALPLVIAHLFPLFTECNCRRYVRLYTVDNITASQLLCHATPSFVFASCGDLVTFRTSQHNTHIIHTYHTVKNLYNTHTCPGLACTKGTLTGAQQNCWGCFHNEFLEQRPSKS